MTDPFELLDLLELPRENFIQDEPARRLFSMRVPRPFIARMATGNPNDPLFKQVMTRASEMQIMPGYSADPLEEQTNQTPGILHKYHSRVLLIVRGGCAINCRYCFRRHFPYQDNHLNIHQWQKALEHIRNDKNINEVILSGGDPLMAKDEFLAWLTRQLETIPHVQRLRIHTRLPIVIPSRIGEEFIAWFCHSRLKPILIIHVNHANEIDHQVKQKLRLLRQHGVTLLNQSVLLKDINDNASALAALSETLFDADVLPYYLHLLDKVEGAHHFDVSEQRGIDLMKELIRRLPGFLVPRLVREIAGQPGKTPIDLRIQP